MERSSVIRGKCPACNKFRKVIKKDKLGIPITQYQLAIFVEDNYRLLVHRRHFGVPCKWRGAPIRLKWPRLVAINSENEISGQGMFSACSFIQDARNDSSPGFIVHRKSALLP